MYLRKSMLHVTVVGKCEHGSGPLLHLQSQLLRVETVASSEVVPSGKEIGKVVIVASTEISKQVQSFTLFCSLSCSNLYRTT